MLLSEVLYQRVQGLGVQGLITLKPGYVALVSRAHTIRHALVAALFPGHEADKYLPDGTPGTTRIGVGVVANPTAPPHRVLRELGGERQLQRFDPGTKKYETISTDSLDIESFLRLECGLPSGEQFGSFFCFDATELPSLRGKPVAPEASLDQKRVNALKAELEATKKYEALQDELFKTSDRLLQLDELMKNVAGVEAELAELDAQRGKVQYTPEQQANIISVASRMKEIEKERDVEMEKITLERKHLRDYAPPQPAPFFKEPMFLGGIIGWVAIDAAAILARRPWIALVGLGALLVALIAVLNWIAAHEADELQKHAMDDLKAREDKLKRDFLDEVAPVRMAMRVADLDSMVDLIELFRQKELLDKKRAPVVERLEKLKADERLATAPQVREQLAARKAELDALVQAQGFARPISHIESELKEALGLVATGGKQSQVPDADVPKALFAETAQLLATNAEPLAAAIEPRLAAYLTALSDKKIVAGRMDANGQLMLSTPDGRWGPYAGLPIGLRDLAYVALRLSLLERVAPVKKAPIFVDDAFAPLDGAKKGLIGKMLKGISAQAQVLHRVTAPPPAGAVDHVVQLA